METNEEWAWLTFERLEAAYFEQGSYESITPVYQEFLAKYPKQVKAHVALAKIKLKKGQTEEALEEARLALEEVPGMPAARAIQIQGLARSGGSEIALSDSLALLDELIEKERRFKCCRCNRVSGDLEWRCAQCNAYGTMTVLPCAPSS